MKDGEPIPEIGHSESVDTVGLMYDHHARGAASGLARVGIGAWRR